MSPTEMLARLVSELDSVNWNSCSGCKTFKNWYEVFKARTDVYSVLAAHEGVDASAATETQQEPPESLTEDDFEDE